MDAVEFLDKVDRLSKKGTPEEKMCYNDYRTAGDNTWAVKFVEQWAKEHPVKTRQSEFLEHYPDARIDPNTGALDICPTKIFGGATEINCNVQPCFECEAKFWLAEAET